MGVVDISGAQFGTVISYPLSGLLAEYGFSGGWPSIFYVFGIIGAVWSVAFLFMVAEDPDSSRRIAEDEKKYITTSLWGAAGVSVSIGYVQAIFVWKCFKFSINIARNCDGHTKTCRFLFCDISSLVSYVLRQSVLLSKREV
jgi:MFS family permease